MKIKLVNSIKVSLILFIFVNICPLRADPLFQSLYSDPQNYDKVLVEKVTGADTFVLETGETIKLIGLHAEPPPKKKEVIRNEFGIVIEQIDLEVPLNEMAYDFVKNLLEKKYVRLEFDVNKNNEDFKTLAYAFLEDQTFVNAEIVRQGFAHLRLKPPNMKYADLLRAAYQEAKKEKRGLQSE